MVDDRDHISNMSLEELEEMKNQVGKELQQTQQRLKECTEFHNAVLQEIEAKRNAAKTEARTWCDKCRGVTIHKYGDCVNCKHKRCDICEIDSDAPHVRTPYCRPCSRPFPTEDMLKDDELINICINSECNKAVNQFKNYCDDHRPFPAVAPSKDTRRYVDDKQDDAITEAFAEMVTAIGDYTTKVKKAYKDSLFQTIKHGDEQHQSWLKQAIDDHFEGGPVHEPV